MHRTESDNLIVVGGLNQYTDGPPGTTVNAVDKNTIQEELAYVIEQNGITLKTVATETNQQLYAAIAAQIASAAPGSVPLVDWGAKNLIINFQSNTTVDADADRVSMLNGSNVPAFKDSLNETFNITTDLMAGTSEKASHWYQLWISVSETNGAVTRLMVPDLESTTDGTTANKLVDSGADFVTDKVQVGDIVYNLTDFTQTTVTAVDDANTLSLNDDIFVSGENYKIHILSPTGLSSFKANIGMAYNNGSFNIDDSGYTKPKYQNSDIIYSDSSGDFTLSGTGYSSTIRSLVKVSQDTEFSGVPKWKLDFQISINASSSARTGFSLSMSGWLSESTSNFNQSISGRTDIAANANYSVFCPPNTTSFNIEHASTTTSRYHFGGLVYCDKKPTFATRS